MYRDTITVFNRKPGTALTGDSWYPSVIRNVNINADRASILAKYGHESQDNAILFIPYKQNSDGDPVIVCADGTEKLWLTPKEWDGNVNHVTFSPSGDFFWKGEWTGGIESDFNYKENGFFGHMNSAYDDVYVISKVAKFSVIPHFEIMGK